MPQRFEDGGARRYQSQWQAYRARRTLLGVLVCVEFVSFIPLTIFAERALTPLLPTGNSAFLVTSLMFGAVYLFTVLRLRSFPCPRCGKNFFGGFFATPETVWGQDCANCGLRKYDGE